MAQNNLPVPYVPPGALDIFTPSASAAAAAAPSAAQIAANPSLWAKYGGTAGLKKGSLWGGLGYTAGSLLQNPIQGSAGDAGGARDYAASITTGALTGAGLGAPLGPWGIAGGALLGGLAGGLFEYFDEDTGKVVKGSIPLPPMDQRRSVADIAALYDKYMGGGGGGAGAASRLNQAEMQALNDYWRNLNVYGRNREAALRDMFSGLSASTLRSGAATQRSGTDLAADIENLYARLGESASRQVVAEGSPTAGLAPMAGEAALSGQTIPSQGAGLANYLAAATGAQAQNIYDIGRAQAFQGASLTQNYLDALAMAEQQAILQQRQRAAARIAQANAAAASARNARNQFLMQYELEGMIAEDAANKAKSAALFNIGYSKALDPAGYKNLEKVSKGLGFDSPEALATARPDLAVNLFSAGQ